MNRTTQRIGRYLAATLLACFLIHTPADAQTPANKTITLAWDASPDTDVIKYTLYWGPSSGVYTGSKAVGVALTTTFGDFFEGVPVFFVVTASNANAESEPSNEVSFTPPYHKPTPPGGLRFQVVVQTSSNGVDWKDDGAAVMASTEPHAFYRLKVDAPVSILKRTPPGIQ